LLSIVLAGCNGTTGSGLVTFTARAGGPSDAQGGAPIAFDTGSGYHMTLTRVKFHFGAIYLNMSVPSSGGSEQPCALPGIYVGQAFGSCTDNLCGVDLDLLTSDLVTLPIPGQGTENPAKEAEVWLTGGDINAPDDPTPILDVAGTATRMGQSWPFTAIVTIGKNRAIPPQSPALPGSNPICHQRIASPIPVDFTLTDGGELDLRVDPRGMWNGFDFAGLTPPASGNTYVIPDDAGGVENALYKGVIANSGVYQFTWTDHAP
jgi:hypothetical protein